MDKRNKKRVETKVGGERKKKKTAWSKTGLEKDLKKRKDGEPEGIHQKTSFSKTIEGKVESKVSNNNRKSQWVPGQNKGGKKGQIAKKGVKKKKGICWNQTF